MRLKVKKQLTGKGEITEEHIEYVDEEIYIPPDVTAQIFWLKNRKPKQWRDKIDKSQEPQSNELLESLYELEKNHDPVEQ